MSIANRIEKYWYIYKRKYYIAKKTDKMALCYQMNKSLKQW